MLPYFFFPFYFDLIFFLFFFALSFLEHTFRHHWAVRACFERHNRRLHFFLKGSDPRIPKITFLLYHHVKFSYNSMSAFSFDPIVFYCFSRFLYLEIYTTWGKSDFEFGFSMSNYPIVATSRIFHRIFPRLWEMVISIVLETIGKIKKSIIELIFILYGSIYLNKHTFAR